MPVHFCSRKVGLARPSARDDVYAVFENSRESGRKTSTTRLYHRYIMSTTPIKRPYQIMNPTEEPNSTMALGTYFWNNPIFALADFPFLLDEFRDVAAPAQQRVPRLEGSMVPRPK
jgi:hypothetical protein